MYFAWTDGWFVVTSTRQREVPGSGLTGRLTSFLALFIPPSHISISTPYPADPANDGWNTAKLDLTEDWSRAEPGPHPDCCEDLEEGWRCRPDKNHCHRYVVNDETALSADVGFMFDFQVDSYHRSQHQFLIRRAERPLRKTCVLR